MPCPHCRSKFVSKRRQRTTLGYEIQFCNSCRRQFNERTETQFNDLLFPKGVVLMTALWRHRYKLGFRDAAELLLPRGFEVSHETICAFGPLSSLDHSPPVPGVIKTRLALADKPRQQVVSGLGAITYSERFP